MVCIQSLSLLKTLVSQENFNPVFSEMKYFSNDLLERLWYIYKTKFLLTYHNGKGFFKVLLIHCSFVPPTYNLSIDLRTENIER